MKVRDIMTQTAVTCGPETNLGAAVELLWVHNYGMLPVVDGNDVPQGVLSMDDILLHADQNKWESCCELSSEEIIRSLKKMHGQQFPIVHPEAVAA